MKKRSVIKKLADMNKLKKFMLRREEHRQRMASQKDGFVFKRTTQDTSIDTSENSITVILNVYKRSGYFAQQVEALRAQTHPPTQIWAWCNEGGTPMADFSDIVDRVIISNHNWKFFGRFSLANLVETKYVAFFDDDMLPQPRWFENCLQTIAAGYDGILGAKGVLLPESGDYLSATNVGWEGGTMKSRKPEVVDFAGHGWFGNKRYFSYMWLEEPFTWHNGEDMHLSCMALKYGGVKTYIPPHPEDELDLWSCDPLFGKVASQDDAASFKLADHLSVRDAAVRYYCENGWKFVKHC